MSYAWLGIVFSMSISLLLGASVYIAMRKARRRATYAPLTENRLRLPGHSLNKKLNAEKEKVESTFLITALIAPSPMYFFFAKTSTLIIITAFICSLAVGIWASIRLYKMYPEIQNLLLGLECEEYVGQELNLLMRSGAYVFHDIPCKNGNIDHVVIGHGQALAIETKLQNISIALLAQFLNVQKLLTPTLRIDLIFGTIEKRLRIELNELFQVNKQPYALCPTRVTLARPDYKFCRLEPG